jgi:hypothetical protein
MRRLLAVLCAVFSAAVLTACAGTTSGGSFKGVEHEAAQPISSLQSAATAGEEKKICTDVLAAGVVASLKGVKGCEAAIKARLAETDSMELTTETVSVAKTGTSATAKVNSVYAGKKRIQTVSLVKEGGKWKISGL